MSQKGKKAHLHITCNFFKVYHFIDFKSKIYYFVNMINNKDMDSRKKYIEKKYKHIHNS